MSDFTQDDLDAINRAIATGAKKVRFQTHEVEYASIDDMLRARDIIRGDLQPSADTSRVHVARFFNGFSGR